MITFDMAEHALATADKLGFLMPSFCGTAVATDFVDRKLAEIVTVEVCGVLVAWERLTPDGMAIRQTLLGRGGAS